MDKPADKPVDMPSDTPSDMPSDQGDQNSAPKIIKTDISKLKLDITSTNNTSKNDVLEALKKQEGLEKL
ncbi:BspA family leucine-rich repeat surface protein, partial [Escherichia coli]|nr:BspA family leucine-rich repeat surface protein [Escherichia coli]